MTVDNTYQTAIYETDGGNRTVVGPGGKIDMQGGTIGAAPAVTKIATPASATASDVATLLNSVIDALKAAGITS